jgi:predicted O-methyltransferase YrrM
MSYVRLARALLHGKPYFGSALRSLQGLPARHAYMAPLVSLAAEAAGHRPLKVLEVGSWAGSSAVTWGLALKSLPNGGRLVCVDPWKPYFDVSVESDPIYSDMNAAAEEGDVFRLFLHNLRAARVDDLVEHRIGTSEALLPTFTRGTFNLVYLDGSHAAAAVKRDISEAARLVCDGGIVCGDDLELERTALDPEEHRAALASGRDYAWSSRAEAYYHPGVTEAVAELVGDVSSWEGMWAARRVGGTWGRIELPAGDRRLPAHIVEALQGEEEAGPSEGAERSTPAPPRLVLQGFHGFNLVEYGGRVHAVHQALGRLDLTDFDGTAAHAAGRYFVADSIVDAKRQIEATQL